MSSIKQALVNEATSIANKTLVEPVRGLVDDALKDIVTTIGSFVIRSVRGKFQRSITFSVGVTYADQWLEEALYGILYEYNNIKGMSRLELKDHGSDGDGSGVYYQLDDGAHNLKYRDYNIMLVIQTNIPNTPGRIRPQRLYTIITYNLSEDFVRKFENDMITHRNSLLKIKKDSPLISIYQDYHESDGYTYWGKIHSTPKRRLSTVYLPYEQKKRIVDRINEFFASKEYYHKHGIAHNLKILLYGPPGPQPVDEPIMLGNGRITTIGELEVGMTVFASNGSPTVIEEIYEYEEEMDIYKVTMDDLRSTTCTEDHKFPVFINGKLIRLSVKDIISIFACGFDTMGDDDGREYHLTNNVKIPKQFPIEFKVANDKSEVDGWLTGYTMITAWFTNYYDYEHPDGGAESNSRNLHLYVDADIDNERIEEIARRMNCHYLSNANDQLFFVSDNSDEFITKEIFYNSKEIGFIETDTGRDICESVLLSDISTRMSVLQGIMDAAGCVSYNPALRRHQVLLSLYDYLHISAISVLRLIRSLGYMAYLRQDSSTTGVSKKIVFDYTGDIQMSGLFRYSIFRNLIRNNAFNRQFDFGLIKTCQYIQSITKLREKKRVRCIHVQDDSHIYLTGGADLIPTCNSGKDSIAKMIASEWNRNIYYVTGGKDNRFIPNALVDDSADIHHPLMLISDIDKYPYLISEPVIDMDDATIKDERIKQKQQFGSMINALDGVLSGEDRIIIMTTNHIEKFSDVFLRDGRVDIKEEIGHVTPEVFRKYCHDFYKFDLPRDIELSSDDITIAKLQTDVVFKKLTVEEFIDKYVKKK